MWSSYVLSTVHGWKIGVQIFRATIDNFWGRVRVAGPLSWLDKT